MTMTYVRRRSSMFAFVVGYHKVSGPNIPRTVLSRIRNFCRDIYTNLLYSQTRYDITNYFWSKVIVENNRRKGRLRQLKLEFLENGLSHDHQISHAYLGELTANSIKYDSKVH